MYCKNCGKPIDDNASFCSSCGTRTDGYQPVQQPTQQPVVNVVNNNTNVNNLGYRFKRKWTAFWLCLLFGYLGIHRFYVGKTFTGIIWLFTMGLFGIGWILDLLVILFGGFKDTAGQRLI